MPKKAPLDTPALRALKAARNALDAAKEKDAKASTPATKTALEQATKAFNDATAVANAERFRRVGKTRTEGVVLGLKNVAAIFNPKTYVFNKEQADKVLAAVRDAVADLETTVERALDPKSANAAPGKVSIEL